MFFVSSYSTTEKLRLLSNYQDLDCSLGVFADYHEVRTANMTKWIKQFLLAGLAGLIRPKHNQKYSLKTKIAAVKDYQLNGLASREVLIKYKIRHIFQLKQWIIQYNSDKLTVTYATRKRVKKMGRKVSFDEKKQIVQWTINHQNNYKEAASKYDISYQRVYSWVRKYLHDHNWEVLKDNRGRNKEKEPTNELERLRKRVRELEAFAKKLVEIRNREVHRPDDIKRFKK